MDKLFDVCPICYDTYREPKGLPCFHTFCKECLQNHINNKTAGDLHFNCPVCRKQTEPFGGRNISVSQWASSFPTNNYVLNQYLEISQKQCPAHNNELLDISCKTCRVMICYQCCLGAHEKCEKTLTKFNIERIKNSLNLCVKKLKVKLEPLENRMDILEKNRESTESKIKQMTQELVDFVKSQEEYWLKRIEVDHSKECSTLEEQRENLVQTLEMAQENMNDIENLLGDENIEDGSKCVATFNYQPRHALTPMTTDSVRTREAEANFEINPTFVKLEGLLLKTSMVKTDEDSDEITTIDDVEAALFGTASAEVTEMQQRGPRPRPFQLVNNIILNVNLLTGINDMIMIPNQCFLITEACFKKIWKFSTTGQCLKQLVFNTEPYGLCLLQENCVAVSQPYGTKISILNSGDLSEKESFTFGKRYYGLASDDNEKIYTLYRDRTMCVDIIMKNALQSPYEIFQVIALPIIFYTCFDYRLRALPSGHLLIINSAKSMNCLDLNGHVAFCYEGDSSNKLCSIADIAVSRNFIYIADKSANNIHRIRHTGTFVDMQLMSNNGMSEPKKIFAADGDDFAILCKPVQNLQIQLFSNEIL